jgi:hypothetical protein
MLENYTEGAILDRKAREILTLIVSKTIERGVGQYTVGYVGSLVRNPTHCFYFIRITGSQAKLSSLNLWHKTIKNLYGSTNPKLYTGT